MHGLKPGATVKVPWGLDHLVGTVREVYGPPGKPFAMVEVPVHGASGEVLETTTVSFPVDVLALVPAA
ncbi:MAG: hypothetical protein ACRDZR_09405 [Acidimicrobiales bacterium]